MILTCKNHPELRWSCKTMAWSGYPGHYNGSRNIFFFGILSPKSGSSWTTFRDDGTYVAECKCPPADLVVAPECEQAIREEVRKMPKDLAVGLNEFYATMWEQEHK